MTSAYRHHDSAAARDFPRLPTRGRPSGGRLDYDAITAALKEVGRLESLAAIIAPPPTRSTAHELCWGESFAHRLRLSGSGKRGRGSFKSFNSGERGGGPLAFIAHFRGCPLGDAAAFAADWLGLDLARPLSAEERARLDRKQRIEEERAALAAARLEAWRAQQVRTILEESVPVEPGSSADHYLQVTRGIPAPEAGWPARSVRWHAGERAMVLPMPRADGSVPAVQLVYLTADGRKIDATEAAARKLPDKAKKSIGLQAGAFIRFAGRPGVLAVAEGPETTITVWRAAGYATVGCVGGLLRLLGEPGSAPELQDVPRETVILLARDDDSERNKSAPKVDERVAELRAAGWDVRQVWPWDERRRDGADLNDLAQAEGIGAVAARVDAVLGIYRPRFSLPDRTPDEARAVLRDVIPAFFRRTLDWHGVMPAEREAPEHGAIIVDTGLGKTTTTIDALGGFVAEAKQRGLPHRVLWLVPTHKLGGEAELKIRAAGLNAETYRGLMADVPGTGDPENDVPPTKACLNVPAAEDALAIGADVRRSVCGPARTDRPRCPFRGDCHWHAQIAAAAAADVLIAAHEYLFTPLPEGVGEFGLVVVDEDWWKTGLRPGSPLSALSISGFGSVPLIYPVRFQGKMDNESTNDLHALAMRLERALEAMKPGDFVTRQAILSFGLTAADCDRAIRLERDREVDSLKPGMSANARRDALVAAEGNREARRRAAIWRSLRELLEGDEDATGRLIVDVRVSDKGSTNVIIHHARLPIAKRIAQLPLLALGATMPFDFVCKFLPEARLLARVRATLPHAEVHQIVGGFGRTSLVPDKTKSPAENKRRRRFVDNLAYFTKLASGGSALVITYQGIEDRFAGPGMSTGHFNAIAGLDEYRNVSAGFTIGRPLPCPQDIRGFALALTGRPIPVENPIPRMAGVLMADGLGRPMETRGYADPDLEAVRAAITDAEVIQAIGRVRAVNRTDADPVRIYVMSDCVLPIPITSLSNWHDVWREVRPDRWRQMVDAGAVFFSGVDAHSAYPELFVSEKAAKRFFEENGRELGPRPLYELLIGDWGLTRLVQVRYRPVAEGRPHVRRALVAADGLPGFRAELERMLGATLAVYAVDGFDLPAANAPVLVDPVRLEPNGPGPEDELCVDDPNLEAEVPDPPAWLFDAPPPEPDPFEGWEPAEGPDGWIPRWLTMPEPSWHARAGP